MEIEIKLNILKPMETQIVEPEVIFNCSAIIQRRDIQ